MHPPIIFIIEISYHAQKGIAIHIFPISSVSLINEEKYSIMKKNMNKGARK